MNPAWLDTHAWPYNARAFQHADGRLHYIDEGYGAPIVLVHGTPTWSFEWRHVIAALRSTHRVIAADHLGFGLSARPARADYTPEAHAARFRAFIESLALTDPLTLVVHDFGGPIALDWALDVAAAAPNRLARVVIVNTFMWSFADDAAMSRRAKLVDNALGRWMYRRLNASLTLIMPSAYGDRARLDRDVHARYRAVFPDPESRERVLYTLARALTHSAPFYEQLWARRAALSRVKASLLWGLADSAFPPSMLARWQAAVPTASVHPFAGVGHWPHDEAPDAFIAALGPLVNAESGCLPSTGT